MEHAKRREQAVVAGAAGAVLGLALTLVLSPWFWWAGALLGAFLTASLWMYQEIAYAVPLAAKAAMSEKVYIPHVWQVLAAVGGGVYTACVEIAKFCVAVLVVAAKYEDAVTRWRFRGYVLLFVFMVLAVAGIPLFSAFIPGDTKDTVVSPVVVYILITLFGGGFAISVKLNGVESRRVPGREPEFSPEFEIKWIQTWIAVFSIVGLVPFVLYQSFKERRAICRVGLELGKATVTFFVELFRLLYSQALVRSLGTGFFCVAVTYWGAVRAAELSVAPTLVLGGLTGAILGYFFLPEPSGKTVQEH